MPYSGISMLIKNRISKRSIYCSVHCDCQNGYVQLGQSVHPADSWCQSRQVLIPAESIMNDDCVVSTGCPRLTRQATTAAPHHHWWPTTILNLASIFTLLSIYSISLKFLQMTSFFKSCIQFTSLIFCYLVTTLMTFFNSFKVPTKKSHTHNKLYLFWISQEE